MLKQTQTGPASAFVTAHNLSGSVGGPVVYDDNLEHGFGLRKQAVERRADMRLRIENWHDDAEAGASHLRSIFRNPRSISVFNPGGGTVPNVASWDSIFFRPLSVLDSRRTE